MHYKNGREAKEGDPVVFVETWPTKRVNIGIVHSFTPAATTCNCQVSKIIPGAVVPNNCTTLGELYHAEDALLAIEPTALQPKG